MGIVDQSLAHGFTHVRTYAGWIPVEQFHQRDCACMAFDAERGCFLGPKRTATTAEAELWALRGGAPSIALQGRDVWPLTKGVPS